MHPMLGRLFRGEVVDCDDAGDLQTITMLGQLNERLEQVHRVMPHGFHSVMPEKSHGLGLQFGYGGRTLKAFLGGELPKHRPRKREVGSTAIYDANENIVSLVQKEVRVSGKHATVVESGEKTTVKLKDGTTILLRKGRIDLGAEEGTHAVMTEGGKSSVVYAKV